MQGLIETVESKAPTDINTSGYRRYLPTLVAFVAPAFMSGLVAAFVYADAKRYAEPEANLAVRAEMVRYAAQKVPTVSRTGASLARTEAEHLPVDDVSFVANTEAAITSN